MSEQPEALRLADLLERMPLGECDHQAAAELRRQHEEITELRHGAGVAHQTIAGLVAQRDALLEALKRAADFLHHATEFRFGHPGFEQTHAKARVAIKTVEEGK